MDYLQENTFFIPSPAPASEQLASPDDERQRKQDMDYLSNYLLSGQYPEHRALAEQAHGHDPYANAPEEERKCFVGRKACGILLGSDQVPDMYFRQQNLPIPEGVDTREKMYMAVYDHLDGVVRQAKQKQLDEQKALEQYGQQLVGRIDRACKSSGEQWTPKDIDMMGRAGITPDIINRVRAAYAKLPVGSFILDDADAADVMIAAGLNKDDLTPDDKKVEDILMNLWGKAVYDNYGANIDRKYDNVIAQYAYENIKPIHNLYYSTLSGAMGVLENLRNVDADVPAFMMPGDRMAYGSIPFDNKNPFLSAEEMRQDKGLLRTIDFRAKMKNIRKAAQQAYTEGRQTWGVNKFAVALGDMVGQSVPNAIPYFGVYSLLKGSSTQRYEEGVALGLSHKENIKRAGLFSKADTIEEKVGMAVLGKIPVLGRLLNAGLNKTGLPYNSMRARYLANETAQIWGSTLAGAFEEGVAEPIVGGITRAVMSNFLDDERGKTSLSAIPGDILQNFQGYQGLALAFYSRGFVKLAEPQIRRNVKHFAESLDGFTALGGSESGYLRALEIKDTDVRNGFIAEHLKAEWANNPEQAARRAEQGNAALLGKQEIAQLRELESFRALQERGVIPRFEPAQETGKYRVYLDEETAETRRKAQPSEEEISAENTAAEQTQRGQNYALMTEDQLNTLLTLSIGERERDTILWAQNLLAAENTVEFLEQQGWKTENIGQTETSSTLRTLARQATATVRLLEASGLTRQEALASVNPDISEHASLQSIITAYSGSRGRAATARRRGEQTSFASNAYVIRQQDPVNGGFQQILRFSRGEATVENLWEETMEQAAINWCSQENLAISTFGSQLQDMQRTVNQLYGKEEGVQFIGLDAVPTSGDVVEALSLIGRSRLMHDVVAGNSSLPSWIQKLVRFVSSFLEQFRAKAELGHAIAKLENSGQLTPEMQNLINAMTGAVDSIHARDIRQEADIVTAVESSISEHEAAFTRAATSQTKTLEDIRAELDNLNSQSNSPDEPIQGGLSEQAIPSVTEAAIEAFKRKNQTRQTDVLSDMTREGLVSHPAGSTLKTPSQIGAFIGANASPDLIGRLKNPDYSLMDEKAAYTICQLTTDAAVQQWAGEQIQQGQSMGDIVAGIQQRDAALSGGQIEYDIFGNAIFNNAEFDHVTRYVNACKAEISRVETLLQNNNSIVKDQPLARSLGLSMKQQTDLASIRKQLAALKIAYNNIGVHPEITAAGRLWKEGEPVHPLKDIPELRLENVEKTDAETIPEPRRFDDGEVFFSASLSPIRQSAANVQPEGARSPRIGIFHHGLDKKDYQVLPLEEKQRLSNRGLDELYPMASAVMQDFDAIVRGIGERLGLRVMMRQTLKGRERALQKTVEDNKGDAGKLLDVFGGTLVMPDNVDFSQVVSAVKESGMEMVRIKNGYKAHDPYGYADIKLNVQMPNGFIGEIILIEEHMMRMKEGPGHKIYEVGRNLEIELNQNKDNPDYGEKRRRLVTRYVEALQQLSRACYGNQGQEPIKEAEQEARQAHSLLPHSWAFSNASSSEESGIVPLEGLGEGVYLDSTSLTAPAGSTSTWYVFPDLSEAQEASPSPLVQNLTSSTSEALNNISTDNVASSLHHVKSAVAHAEQINAIGLHPFDIVTPKHQASTLVEARRVLTELRDSMMERMGTKKTSRMKPIPGKGIVAPGTDFEVFVTRRTIDKATSGKASSKSISKQAHYLAAANIDRLWEKSFSHGIEPDKNGAQEIKGVHKRTAYMRDGENIYRVKLTAKQYNSIENTNHLYSVEVEDILLEEQSGVKSHARQSEPRPTRQTLKQEGNLEDVRQSGHGSSLPTPQKNISQTPPQVNFSLAQASVISRLVLAPRAHEARARSLMRGIDEAMNRWNIAASSDVTHDSAARTFGELNSILAEIQRILPDDYKINMRPYLNFGAAYARMLETGRIRSYGNLSPEQRNTLAAELQTLMDSPDVLTAIRGEMAGPISVQQETSGRGVKEYAQAYRSQEKELVRSLAEGRLNTLLTSIMTDVRGQLEQYLKDESVAKVLDRIARLMPKKKDSGKYGKGSLPADAYRTLGQYLAMLDADAPAVEAETAKLEALIREAALNQTEAAEGKTITTPYEYAGRKENLTLDQLESKLADWQTFGNLADMNLDETRSAMEAIITFIQTSRTVWGQKNRQEAWQNEKLACDISKSIRQHVIVDEQAVRDANENAASSRIEWVRAWFSGLQSFSQMLESLSAIDGMKKLSQYGISEIAKANVSLNTRENNHAAAFAQIIRENAGLHTKSDVQQWILDSKITHDTGAVTAPVREKNVTLDTRTAQEYIDLIEADDREGFEAKRQHIMETARRQDIRPERLGLITEMDIPALMDELAAHPRAGKITITSRIPDKKGSDRPLRLSKAQAMYQILLYEQDRYKPNFEKHGYTDQTMQALYRYAGQDGLAVAYGLRDYINQCGEELADVFEKLTGVPFPKEQKYFRAKFNRHEGDAKTALIGEGNNVTGHKYSMLITRKKHNLGLDLSADVFTVANASLAETDNYICTRHITTKFRGVLSHGYAADALKVKMGAQRYRQLVTWLDLIDGAGTLEAAQLMAHSKIVGRMQGAKANALLAYNLLTCIKQTSAILHPLASGKIGLGELMKEYSFMLSGNSHFTFADMMRTDAFQSRFRKEPVIREILNYGADQHFGYGRKIAMAGMVPLEKMDVWSNAVSHVALANAVFRKLEKENATRIRHGEEPMTAADMEQIALDEVRQSLELAAQPTRTSQKSMLSAMGGTLTRLWTFMGSEAINKFGNLVTFAQKGQWGKLTAAWASLSIWEQTMVTLWMLLMNPPGDNDKDKEKFWKQQVRATPLAMVGSVPAVGSFFDTVFALAGWGRWNNYGSQIIPASTAVSKIKKATKKKATWQDTFNASLSVLQCLAIGGGVFSDSRSKPVAETASALIGLSAAANIPKIAIKATEAPKKKKS